jgi:UDP:flavonoid glycosyltransferase YjiC (YdhE family)
VDVSRPECHFPWQHVLPPKPIIYCALGTINIVTPEQYRRFYEAVINAFSDFSDRYYLVIATGEHFEPARLQVQGSGVTVVKRAPQIALLKLAALMITHGGSNSVRECVTLGVPMLLYPISFDAFGFSARAVFHGLGLAGDFRHFSARGIRERMGQLLESPNFRLQARRMQSEFLRAQNSGSTADLVETFVNDPAMNRGEQAGPANGLFGGLEL